MIRKLMLLLVLAIFATSLTLLFSADSNKFAEKKQAKAENSKNYKTVVYKGDKRASNDEVAAAIKNFNPEVEEKYRKDNPNMNKSYELLNSIEADWNFDTFLKKEGAAWDKWRQDGKVGEFAQ